MPKIAVCGAFNLVSSIHLQESVEVGVDHVVAGMTRHVHRLELLVKAFNDGQVKG